MSGSRPRCAGFCSVSLGGLACAKVKPRYLVPLSWSQVCVCRVFAVAEWIEEVTAAERQTCLIPLPVTRAQPVGC